MESLTERVDRVEREIDTLQRLVNDERVAIENLRNITAEHSKQIEKLGKTIEDNSKNISKLYSLTGRLEEKTTALINKVDDFISITKEEMDNFKKFAEFSLQLNKSIINSTTNKTFKSTEKQMKYNVANKVIDIVAKLSLIALAVLLGISSIKIL